MTMWLVSSICRRPARSISSAATRVPTVFTTPTIMLPSTGDCNPALANTCAAASNASSGRRTAETTTMQQVYTPYHIHAYHLPLVMCTS